jgi:hypothetical protein
MPGTEKSLGTALRGLVSGAVSHLLEATTVTNIRRWTFAKPPLAPFKRTIVYEYEIDTSVPLDGPTNVAFDLPERVTIVASDRSVQTSSSTKKN